MRVMADRFAGKDGDGVMRDIILRQREDIKTGSVDEEDRRHTRGDICSPSYVVIVTRHVVIDAADCHATLRQRYAAVDAAILR